MCGIIGIIGDERVSEEIYIGLNIIQHRGQDSCGICTYNGKFHLQRYEGLVQNAFKLGSVNRLIGNIGIGHVRYPTAGKGGIEDAQPFFVNYPYGISIAHNGNIANYKNLSKVIEKEYKRIINSSCDIEVFLNILAHNLENSEFSIDTLKNALIKTTNKIIGSYSVVAIIGNYGLLAYRDPYGFRPLVFGKRNNNFIFSSESCAIDTLGYELVRDVKPGEMIFINNNREFYSEIITEKEFRPCIFEYVYFARPDSMMNNILVARSRYNLGKTLAEKINSMGLKPDVVVPIPDTARNAALAVAKNLHISYQEGLIKNRYIGRTFIMPGQDVRVSSIRQKLHPVKEQLKGKKVLLVDDSIVRGNTSKELVNLVRNTGAKEVYFASYSPPVRYPCYYGIDIQTESELIANKMNIEGIRKYINADALIYQDCESMIKAIKKDTKINFNKFCTACFSGDYPQKIPHNILKDIADDRKKKI
jgi:amidophosphoribosyltransferase